MNIFKAAYCRAQQFVFKVAIPFLPYRSPIILDSVQDVPELIKSRNISRVLIVTDKSKWGAYMCKPSQFFNTRDSEYYPENADIAEYECEFIAATQLADGSWDIPWRWEKFPDEWAISKNWWKGEVILQNLLYLKGFGKL